MRRPARTRRLSIAAIVSLLTFFVITAAGVRSHHTLDRWNWRGRRIILISGCVLCAYDPASVNFPIHESYSAVNAFIPELFVPPGWSIAGFSKNEIEHVALGSGEPSTELCLKIPLWFPLLLLLIAPIRWLIARPANAAAFPVITSAKQEHP